MKRGGTVTLRNSQTSEKGWKTFSEKLDKGETLLHPIERLSGETEDVLREVTLWGFLINRNIERKKVRRYRFILCS